MSEEIIDLGNGFWSIRGDFRLGGVLNVGTQASLVRRRNGGFVFLDSYTLRGDLRDQVMALTDDGRAVEAVLNVHPFHTVHCEQMSRDFPTAQFYGSARHREKCPNVDWAEDLVESPQVAARFDELAFSLPAGVAYIADNPNIHAGSLLVYHAESQTVHVDDTFNVLPLPGLVRRLTGQGRLSLHPTLKSALLDTPGAAQAFLEWGERIAVEWAKTRHVCAAHSALARFEPGEFSTELRRALAGKRRRWKL